ncbi:DUF4055 domain-containing protein [Actinobacillus porcinus]|uniref:DUF4055 domain-containing protein n=1 Tax=Actinobacillus porcinus TaxID=51048 RepID=UPI0023562D8B|nr:DUF4055 domain-containing protein [Actinobacillus porcinus]MDD7545585.1 DUF4055 domain-containing protein [Actinobacillus porcinus]MDY5847622.1 DUF4055 domain-containing protein [Actinobacillus porcinus]
MSQVSQISAPFAELNSKTKIIDDLLGGTRTMRAAGKAYLYQMELEEDGAYKNRLSRSTLYPALSETLSQMCGRVFFEPINIESVNERIQTEIIPDVDMEGNHLDVFASQWFYAGLAYGVSFVLVDYTQITDVRTLADEKAQGARPYLIHIKPQQVLGVKVEKINGKKQITQFRYVEHITVDDGQFDTKTAKRICVYEIGKVSKYDDIDGTFTLKEDIELKAQGKPLQYVPVVPFVTKKGHGDLDYEPPLLELAYLNIKHWQSQSDQDNILNVARVPLLGIFSDTDISKLSIGGSAIQLPKESTMQYIEHSGNAISAGQDSLKELEEQMKVAGAKLLTKTVLSMTDSQAKDEQGKEISQLRHYANKFEDALDLALEYVGDWLGIEKGKSGNVEITGNIDGDLDPNASMDTVIKLQAAGTLSKQTTFAEAKRRGLLSDEIKWEDEQARLDAEGLNNDFTTDDE